MASRLQRMRPRRIALISTPWQDPFSPSIQLGALAAYTQRERPEVSVDCYHLYLELADAIGVHLAKRISVSWIGEALFSALLFPGQAPQIRRYLESARKDDPAFAELDYHQVADTLRRALRARLDAVDWTQYELVGLSVVFSQTVASMLVAREIKRRAPSVPIVFGGPGVTNEVGRSFLDTLPFVDFVVNGEGERPLVNLIDALASGTGPPSELPGIVHRSSPNEMFATVDQVEDFSTLPVPDYGSYFETLDQIPAGAEVRGRVRIPLETSRGCWWDRSHLDPMRSCAFCNLNLQWHGYREKSAEQSLADIRTVVERHHTPDITLVDNILRVRGVDEFIDGLVALDLGLDIWMEARVTVKQDQLRRLRQAGARVIQFGIEALSSEGLRRMTKGTTTIRNLQAMKLCEQLDVANTANLIVDFPGMDDAVIADTLRTIEFARCYRPLSPADFSLVYQAPAYKAPDVFGIEDVVNYHMYSILFPKDLAERLVFIEKSFASPQLDALRDRWQLVRRALDDWATHYAATRPIVEGGLLLSIQDGGTFLKVRDFRRHEPRFHWLNATARDVYLACDEVVSIERLGATFPSIDPSRLGDLLQEWYEQQLVYIEDDHVLALAVPWGPISQRRALEQRAWRGPRRLIPLESVEG